MEEIIVEQGTYKIACAPNILYSGGIGPCIVVGAIYKRRGYMSHSDTPYMEELDDLLRALKRDIKDRTKLSIYVVGASFDIDRDYEKPLVDHYVEEIKRTAVDSRARALEKILDAGFITHVREERCGGVNINRQLFLFLGEERVEIIEETDEDLLFSSGL